MDMRIRRANISDYIQWDEYVRRHPDGLAYHLIAWKRAVEQGYGFACPYFLAESAGRICGVLPTVHLHWPLSAGRIVSLPYCDGGGPLAENAAIGAALVSAAQRYAAEQGVKGVEFRLATAGAVRAVSAAGQSALAGRATRAVGKSRMLLPLAATGAAVLASLKAKVRSQVKKPLRDGLSTTLGGAELLAPVYAVLCENMRDLGAPVHSRALLEAILRHYGEEAKCAVVWMPDGVPAAAGILLCHPRTVSLPWASSLRRYNRANPNMLLYWTLLAFAADHGYQTFDFGRSTPGEGTYTFKKQWGSTPSPLVWLRVDSHTGAASPCDGGVGASAHWARALGSKTFQNLPVPLATALGSRLRRYVAL
ncbi:MAG: GNAT family N-acetyltransferase [Thermodesulfobacteriota bacterium]